MKVVIITTSGPAYHKYLCAELARRHDVAAVLHPASRPIRQGRMAQHRQSIGKYGLVHHVLQKLARRRFGWDLDRDVAAAEQKYMPRAEADYAELAAPVARDVADINGEEGISLLRRLKPDVVVCSGGPIYQAPLIEAAGTMLNYHTGISPIYNGAWTAFWTYANRQPHMTGGTVMRMSTAIDGGDMLAHYLPEVEPDDTPGSLFIKSIIGGVRLYNEVLDDLAAGRAPITVPQGRPWHYYYGYEWTVVQTLAIRRHVRNGICRRFARPEIVSRYWNLPDGEAARAAMERTLLRLIYDG